jgi:hypothetical protein
MLNEHCNHARSSIYFARLTVDEERCFFGGREEIVQCLVDEIASTPALREIRASFERNGYGNPFAQIAHYAPPPDIMSNRLRQMAIYLAIAHYLEQILKIVPTCVSFYSSGSQPALAYAGCISTAEYLTRVLPIIRENRIRIEHAGRRLPLTECLLVGTDGDDIEGFLQRVVQEMKLPARVFLKDIRSQSAVLIAGFAEELVKVRSAAFDRFPALAEKQPRIHAADGAHMPVYDRPVFSSLNGVTRFSSPRIPLIGTSGETVAAGRSSSDQVLSLLASAVSGPMNTAGALRQVRAVSDQVIVIGTDFGGKVLGGKGHRELSGVKLALDLIAESRLAIQRP